MYRILVADDENIERKVLLKKLRAKYKGQAEMLEAENGREVLSIAGESKVDIFILDIEMPGITGLEAAGEIRKADKDAVILFLTAFDEFSYAKKAITLHALDYLLKPYDDDELFLSVDTAIHYVDELRSGEAKPLPITGEGERIDGTDAGNTVDEVVDTSSGLSGQKLMLDFIEKHYMEDISVQDIASALNYSEAYFCKLFKQNFGRNFISYLSEYRIEKAKKQLAIISVNIKDIGRSVGYPDSNYFAKVFKRITGKSPSEYRSIVVGD